MYQDAILTIDAPEYGLRAGDVGVVVERYSAPGREDGYSVEFFDLIGGTVAVATMRESTLRPPTTDDRPSVRVTAAQR